MELLFGKKGYLMDDSMLLILDQHLNLVGRLSNNGNGTPFYNDVFTRAIADEDSELTPDDTASQKAFYEVDGHANTKNWSHTLDSIYVPSGYQDSNLIVQGNSIAYQDPSNNRWYVMKLNSVTDSHDASGRGLKFATGTNIAANDLSKKIVGKKSFTEANSTEVMSWLLTNTGWTIADDSEIVGATFDVEFDGTETAQSKLQDICTMYGLEIDAYVLFSAETGKIMQKVVEIKRQFGNDNGQTVRYGQDMLDVTREVVDNNLFTKLYILDADGEDSVKTANGGLNYIVDNDANALYNPPIEGQPQTYLEGSIQAQNVTTPTALLAWAKTQLQLFNHPRINYTVTISSDFTANLGDTIRVVDFEMEPELTVVSRVIKKVTSFSDYTQNQVILGEFATVKVVKPGFISDLEDRLNGKIKDIISDLRSGKRAATVQLITPSGKTWSKADDSKIVIARVFVDGTNITDYLSQSAFVWTKSNQTSGIHDLDWEEKHANDGYELHLDKGDVGEITCTIEGDYLKDDATIILGNDNEVVIDLIRDTAPVDIWGDKINDAFQYEWVDTVNKQVITNTSYDYLTHGEGTRSMTTDTKYHRFKLDGTYIDSMIVQGGGHGSSFGARLVDGIPEIWTYSVDYDGNNPCLSKVKWKSNGVVKQGDGVVNIAAMPAVNGKYFRRVSTDFKNGWVLTTMGGGLVEVLKISDLEQGKWNPKYSFKFQQFGLNPVANTEPNFNTIQSNDISFPYMLINSGDGNNKDKRLVKCINVVTESEAFSRENTPDMFGSRWSLPPSAFEPETVGFYTEGDQRYILQGFNARVKTETDSDEKHNVLFKTPITIRDDSGDAKDYISEDTRSEAKEN